MSQRSKPAPVSTFWAGRALSEPSGWRKSRMNTRFQNSM